jgi:DNA processing protein
MESPDFKIRDLRKNEFPELLKEINDPPEKLRIRGEIPGDAEAKYLCVVGSRKFSNYGKEACQKLIAGLRGYNIVIVSGLALGIDAIAHQTALDANLKSIAVPGSGLGWNVIYPSTNKRLAENILNDGGAMISEYDDNFRATPWSFPQRNRIMAGMSHATLVVEAEIKSGTLITSKFATEYNRDVLTIPGSIFSKTSEGPHMLLRLGATPITSSKDILEALHFKIDEEISEENKYKDCSEDELKIIELLQNPMSKDELIRKSGMNISQANTIISILEIKGLIKESLGEIHLI